MATLVVLAALGVFSKGCSTDDAHDDDGPGGSSTDSDGMGGDEPNGAGGQPTAPIAPGTECESSRDGFVPAVSATRTSGKAPLSLYIDATVAEHPNLPERSDKFHKMFVKYDFGDAASYGPGEDVWEASGTPKSQGCCSPTTGHVYGKPGTYELVTTFYDGEGELGVCRTRIDAEEWAAEDTTCVSDSGDFDGCPEGAKEVTSASFDDVLVETTNNRRVLMRRGGVYTRTGNGVLEADGVMIGAYGDESLPYPTAQSDGLSEGQLLRVTGKDIQLAHLKLEVLGPIDTGERGLSCRNIDHLTIFETILKGGWRSITCGSASSIRELHAWDNEIVLTPIATESYGALLHLWDFSFWMGNTFTGDPGDTTEASHDLIRIGEAREAVISYNDHSMSPGGVGIANFRLHSNREEGNAFDDPYTTKWIVLSWNNGVLVNATTGSPSDHADENLFEILAEFNIYDGNVLFNSQRTTLRWNIFGAMEVGDARANDLTDPRANTAGPFWIYGNTCYHETWETCVLNDGGRGPATAGGLYLWGNAAYLPEAEVPLIVEGETLFEEGNVATASLPFDAAPDFQDPATFAPIGDLIDSAPASSIDQPNPFGWNLSRLDTLDDIDAGALEEGAPPLLAPETTP